MKIAGTVPIEIKVHVKYSYRYILNKPMRHNKTKYTF